MTKIYSLILSCCLLAILTSSIKANTIEVSDNFNRSDSTGLGSSWSAVAGTINVSNNTAIPTTFTGSVATSYYNQPLTQADSYVMADISNITASDSAVNRNFGFILRSSSNSSISDGYQATFRPTMSQRDVLLYRISGGTLNLIDEVDISIDNWNPGTFKMQAINSNGKVTITLYRNSTVLAIYEDTSASRITSSGYAGLTFGYYSTSGTNVVADNYVAGLTLPSPKILINPSVTTSTVGTPIEMTVSVDGDTNTFNAAQATVAVSSKLTVSSIRTPSSSACNMQYSTTPTTTNPSFAGALFGTSSTNCNLYTLSLIPNATGSGTVTITNGSIKAYADNSEILSGVQNATITINAATPSATPYVSSPNLTIDSYLPSTYWATKTVTGSKNSIINRVYFNSSTTGVAFPTDTSWQKTLDLNIGTNSFTVYGKDASDNQTTTQTITIKRHNLGDINGDGIVNLTDASLFAVDWNKTSNLTYNLSDMNGDNQVNLTDLSILAKLISL